MKNFIALLIIFVLVIAFSGCNTEDNPKKNIGELEEISNSVSEEQEENDENDEVYEYLKSKGGWDLYLEFLESAYFGGFFNESWDDATEFSPNSFTFYYELTEISRIANEEVQAGKAVPEVMEVPEEQVQSFVMSYFNVSEDYLRQASNYNPEKKTYSFKTEGGFGGGPGYGVYEVESLGNNLYLFRCDTGPEGSVKADITLEIKELGSHRYIACEYSNSVYEENPTAEYTLGTKGEPQTLKVGDSIGEWVLDELKIQLDKDLGTANRATGIFKGNVVLEGKITWNLMATDRYDFIVNEKDAEKIPNYIHPDTGKARTRFMLEIPRMLENYPDLEMDEEMDVRITVSEYRCVFAYTEAMDRMVVTKIEIIE